MARSKKTTDLVVVRYYTQVATIPAGEVSAWEAAGWVADASEPVPGEPDEG